MHPDEQERQTRMRAHINATLDSLESLVEFRVDRHYAPNGQVNVIITVGGTGDKVLAAVALEQVDALPD